MGTPVIGFDFDECLAQAYTIVPFVLFCESLLPLALKQEGITPQSRELLEKSVTAFYDRIAMNEVVTKGTLFRPSLLRLLPKLLALRQEGRVGTLFLYSNNGNKSILEVVDHILALTLQKSPFAVPVTQLPVDEKDGRIHCLTPRAHLDEPCRNLEPKESNGFREKSLEGISACLGVGLTGDRVWYLDDTKGHESLMRSIGNHYIVVKPYNVKLANKKLAETFIQTFPDIAFNPTTREGVLVLTTLQSIFPGYRLTGKETTKVRLDRLVRELNKFSPQGSGRAQKLWSEKETAADLKSLEADLAGAIQATAVNPEAVTAAAYRVPIGGGHTRRRGPKHSRANRARGLRKTRSNSR